MTRFKFPLVLLGLGSLGALSLLAVTASGGPGPADKKGGGLNQPRAQPAPVKQVPQVKKRMDRTKSVIEMPLKAVLAARFAPAPAPAAAAFVNPKVEPGKVRWHADLAAARAAAAKSKKPILLFHMMGRLDQKFC